MQVYLIGSAEQAHASLLEISQAAELVYDKCVTGDENLGGFAVDIGRVGKAIHQRLSRHLNLTTS